MPKTDGQSKRTAAEPNAEIYTPAFVAAFMLDFVEARLGRRLSFADRVLEPGAGDGAFVLPLLERALSAPRRPRWDDPAIDRFLVACETNPASLRLLRERVAARLSAAGCPPARASALLDRWLRPGDFLRATLDPDFDAVVGNPPYVRFDAIADEDTAFYRDRYPTFRGRCDLCVPFFERGLSLLAPGGVFSFICSNRFTKSEYGSRLRALVASRYHVAAYLNLEHAPVFGPDIAAYPAIFVIDRRRGEPTLAGSFDRADAVSLSRSLPPRLEGLAAFPAWYSNDEAWATTDPAAFARRKFLRTRLPSLERSAPGTRFGIGVATGADDVFVLPSRRSDIEAAFQIPLVTGDDVRAGAGWTGRRLLSPLDPDGSGRLADLSSFPGLSAYLHAQERGSADATSPRRTPRPGIGRSTSSTPPCDALRSSFCPTSRPAASSASTNVAFGIRTTTSTGSFPTDGIFRFSRPSSPARSQKTRSEASPPNCAAAASATRPRISRGSASRPPTPSTPTKRRTSRPPGDAATEPPSTGSSPKSSNAAFRSTPATRSSPSRRSSISSASEAPATDSRRLVPARQSPPRAIAGTGRRRSNQL